ncbi:MAG: SMP-30/gluconolactonase/LRE family protein [Planctomycetota bacterium]
MIRLSKWFCVFFVASLCFRFDSAHADKYPTFGKLEPLDSRFEELIAKDAVIEKLAEGFDWSEGPVWVPKEQSLLFSDVPQNVIFQWKEGEKVTRFLEPSGYTGAQKRGGEPGSNGLTLDAEGRLVICQHGDRRVARLESDGKFRTLADRYEGKRFNSPNDLVYNAAGDLYFTDPPYGLLKGNDDPAKELDFNGVYRLSKNGQLTLLTRKISFPNGIGLSPDEKTLYVASSDPRKAIWMSYRVTKDGVADGKVFFDATDMVSDRKGLPDGLCIDNQGNLFATGPGGVLVFSPDGVHLGTIDTGEATANCCFGGDGTVLYIAADMYLCRIKTKTKGIGF